MRNITLRQQTQLSHNSKYIDIYWLLLAWNKNKLCESNTQKLFLCEIAWSRTPARNMPRNIPKESNVWTKIKTTTQFVALSDSISKINLKTWVILEITIPRWVFRRHFCCVLSAVSHSELIAWNCTKNTRSRNTCNKGRIFRDVVCSTDLDPKQELSIADEM